MVVGFCLRALLPLKHPKTNSPATLCQFSNAPEIPFPTSKSAILQEMHITAAGLSRQLGRFLVAVQLVLPLSVR